METKALAGVKKKAKNEGRTIVFIDESGLSERPHRCRTWAPRGQTPVLQYHFNWKMLSAMAGVTWWNFYFRLFPGAIRSPQIIEFLSHLLRHIPGKLLIVWDGVARSPQPHGMGLRAPTTRPTLVGVLACLCAGTEPGRVSVVALETARVAELLPRYFRAVEPLRTPGASSYAQTAYSGDRLLAAGQPVPAVTILCNTQ
jgi:DDE superfamily endonuclease